MDPIKVNQDYSLTPLEFTDIDALLEYLNDPVIFQNTLTIPSPYRLKDAEIFLKAVKQFEERNNKVKDFAIRNREGKQIGGIGLLYNDGLDSHRSEIGYWLAGPYRKRGIMSKAIAAFVRWVWQNTDLYRLDAQVFTGNDASVRVLEKAGFEYEGMHRALIKKGDIYKDVMVYAILRPGS